LSTVGWAVLGAVFGFGIWLVVSTVVPARVTLAQALASMDAEPPATRPSPASLDERVGRLLERLFGGERLAVDRHRKDLTMLGVAPATFMGAKVGATFVGVLLGPALAVSVTLAGGRVDWRAPAIASLVLGAFALFIPDLDVRSRAARQREAFRRDFSGFLNIVTLSLSGGQMIGGALSMAARSGDGWVYALLRRTLMEAEQRGTPPWEVMGRAAEERGLAELSEVAASARLAGTDGAHVSRTLAAKAASLRSRTLADVMTDANEATSRMILPLVGVAAGFLILVGYPAIAHIVGGQ
jgi:tight adherence protein C